MNKSARIPFSKVIKIDRRKSDPVYLQIAYQFIQAIQRRYLEEGDKIPGSRILSKELGVHRKTMVAALEELQMQGWLATRPAVGTFVKNPETRTKDSQPDFTKYASNPKPLFSYYKNYILDAPQRKNNSPYRFTTGEPDYRIIKTHELARFYSSALKRKNIIKKIPEYLPQGNPFFKEQLSYYINLTRGFHVSKDQITTTNSKQVLLYTLTQLLVQTGDKVLTADYSYPFANMIFQQAGAALKAIPTDQEGINIDFIRQHFKPDSIKFLYIQPRYTYPTTGCLSDERRHALLALAEDYHFILIEDDPQYELSFEKTTMLPLFKTAKQKNVIYLGDFGSFLTPGFQTSFMIAPEAFTREAHKYLTLFGRMDIIKEQALGEMIHDGDIHRYRRKALTTYESRRNLFNQLLQTHLSELLSYNIPKGGLTFWLPLKQKISLPKWSRACEKKGLFIPRTCLYQDQEKTALQLGYAHLNTEEMEEAVKILREGYEEAAKE